MVKKYLKPEKEYGVMGPSAPIWSIQTGDWTSEKWLGNGNKVIFNKHRPQINLLLMVREVHFLHNLITEVS